MNYDPAIAANVISGFSFAASAFTLYRLWARDAEEKVARYPDATSSASADAEHPGWYKIEIKITNNFDADLELSWVKFAGGARGLHGSQTVDPKSNPWDPKIEKTFPMDRAVKNLPFRRTFSRAGTPKPNLPTHTGSVDWIRFYAYTGRPSEPLRFSVVFDLRRSDMRRAKTIVIKQQVTLPTKQNA